MTTAQAVGAVSREAAEWYAIDWQAINRNVRRLQVRIVQATKERRWGRVRVLQRLLTHSYSGKVLAARRVTENNGKKTPGVDQEIWDTPEKKTQAVHALKRRGYQSQPLRRVYIPKSDGKTMRPLGIPTMKDERSKHYICLHSPPLWKPPLIKTPMVSVSSGPAPMRWSSAFLHREAQTRSGFWRVTSNPVSTKFHTIGFWLTSRWTESFSKSG